MTDTTHDAARPRIRSIVFALALTLAAVVATAHPERLWFHAGGPLSAPNVMAAAAPQALELVALNPARTVVVIPRHGGWFFSP